ncbi:MAG: polyprenyl synthetase family protein [Alphaproteobacteria bacterium]|nr:polyprenyl synthetase family protein [Alphaproteobacteria bacterium]
MTASRSHLPLSPDTPDTLGQADIAASLTPLVDITASGMAETNHIIIDRMQSEIDLIPTLAGHLIAAGGKRMRPMLTLAGALLGKSKLGKSGETAMTNAAKLAAAVEFIHSATLLHDDVIDQSDMRRGNKSASSIWGNEASVLVGDFLFARAFELMVEAGQISVLGRLANAAARITEGEIDQMILAGNPSAPIEDYYRVIRAKTAELFAAAGEAGAMIADADKPISDAICAYGLALGTAFQITDDALDYAATAEGMGKSQGDDFKEGKITLPVMLAWQDGSEDERRFWQRCLADGDIADGDLDRALSLMNKHDTITRSLEVARSHATDAGQIIAQLASKSTSASTSASGDVAEALIAAANFAADRTT